MTKTDFIDGKMVNREEIATKRQSAADITIAFH